VDDPGSITAWIGLLKAGESAAYGELWKAYYGRMVELALHKLRGRPRAAADEEDAALSAFASFCRGVREGRFPQLNDRHDLWRILFTLTARKVVGLMRGEAREKRCRGRVQHLSALAAEPDANSFSDLTGCGPTPAEAAQVAEELRWRLDQLGDEELRAVAVAKMEGYSNAEIAERCGRSVATVERKLKLIRKLWAREAIR
jgi:DNA-directed RNA polymerase specialized sigma24 family protein